MAAARQIEERGYHATDSNRIARAAGYAPGTFYKHFPDKRAIFLAAYEEWVAREWAQVGEIVARRAPRAETAGAIADAVIAHHRAWPGFRASLKALVALDVEVRRTHRTWRRRQLALIGKVGIRDGATRAIVLLIAERIADALSDGEAAALELPGKTARAYLTRLLAKALGGKATPL